MGEHERTSLAWLLYLLGWWLTMRLGEEIRRMDEVWNMTSSFCLAAFFLWLSFNFHPPQTLWRWAWWAEVPLALLIGALLGRQPV